MVVQKNYKPQTTAMLPLTTLPYCTCQNIKCVCATQNPKTTTNHKGKPCFNAKQVTIYKQLAKRNACGVGQASKHQPICNNTIALHSYTNKQLTTNNNILTAHRSKKRGGDFFSPFLFYVPGPCPWALPSGVPAHFSRQIGLHSALCGALKFRSPRTYYI